MAEKDGVAFATRQSHQAMQLRPADSLMSMERAGAAYPNALSFSRSLVRKLLREKWKTEKLYVRLDEEGRGDAVFRVTGPDRVFHFMAVSNVFPQNQKVDRSFGVNWDISAAICEGEWTPEREADLRVNIPLQRAGRFDSLILAFARGNRSERIFDQVVDTLASGRQPDPKELAGVGYVFRTTGFHANGAVGMRSYDGIGNSHPLGQSYHVQIFLALLMREFVFDLVDHLAKMRGGAMAAVLDRQLKRYLGIGNSAGLGLVPYPSNHARIIHYWTLNNEQALWAARARPLARDSQALAEFQDLLEKAVRYFEQDPRDGNEIFTSCAVIAAELQNLHKDLARRFTAGEADFWPEFLSQAEANSSLETREILYSLLLELHPDIVEVHAGRFQVPEAFDLRPAMTMAELKAILFSRYDWLFASGTTLPEAAAYFWYLPAEASTEPRRARRGVLPEYEYETRMDAPMRALQLRDQLQNESDDASVADFLLLHPEYRHFILHLQSIADCDYGLLRENTLTADYWPFSCMRFVLAFYGMEKLDPRQPRSVKGAFLQGAPLLDDIASGQDGTWPFPLIPDLDQAVASGVVGKAPIRLTETPEAAAKALTRLVEIQKNARSLLPVSASEMRRFLSRYLQHEGFSLGEADQLAMLAVFAQALNNDPLPALYAEIDTRIETGRALRAPVVELRRDEKAIWLDGGNASALGSMIIAMDMAQSLAEKNGQGVGFAHIGNAAGHSYLALLAYQAARNGHYACIEWRDAEGQLWLALAGPEMGASPWLAIGQPDASLSVWAQLGFADMASVERQSYRILCQTGRAKAVSAGQLVALAKALGGQRYFPAGEVGARMESFNAGGVELPVAVAERLIELGKLFLLSPEIEERIR